MTKRTFKSELDTLVLAIRSKRVVARDPVGVSILADLDLALKNTRIQKRRRYLIWGLLIGRSIDRFTALFLRLKGRSPSGRQDTFNRRIRIICSNTRPLTSDLTIKADLNVVRTLRNDLFHTAGRHFNDSEMQTFVFKAARCALQFTLDL